MISLTIAGPSTQSLQRARIEGPSRRQAGRMAAYRLQLLGSADVALAAGDELTAFDRHCEAWDLEVDLRAYGFGKLVTS